MNDFINWAASHDYVFMWCVYVMGALGLLIVLWRLTRSWPKWLSMPLRFIGACVLLVPSQVDAERDLLAPALVVAPFEWLLTGAEAAAPAIGDLLTWAGGALLLICLWFIAKRYIPQMAAKKAVSSE